MTTPQITDLPIEQVRPHPQNVRRELRGLDELAESIKAEGLHQPIIVAPDGDDYVVVMGNSRHAAAEQLGWETIPCIVRADLDTEAKVLSAMLAENCARNDLTITEEGDAFQRLLDLDLSAATVAKRAGRSRKQVADRVTVAGQPEKVRQAVDDRQITLGNALTLAELADDHEMYARVESSIGTPRFDYEVKRAVAIRANLAKEKDLRAALLHDGFIEATREEHSAGNMPVDGYRHERLWSFEPEQSDDTLRFRIFCPSPEYQAPMVQWFRRVPVEPEPDDEAGETGVPAAPAVDTAADAERRAADEATQAARDAAAHERRTAANRRRAFLRGLWENELTPARTDPHWIKTSAELLRRALTAQGYDWYRLDRLGVFLAEDEDDPDWDEDDPRLDPLPWSDLRLQFAAWWCRWAVLGEVEVANYDPNFWEPEAAEYLETLRDLLDYELSDIEEALLDTYHALNDGDGDD